MSGFVYIWHDRKHNRFYVGSHWGAEDDGYICSSLWMLRARSRRPGDFVRKILARVMSSRHEVFIEEQRWLDMIKDEELGKRYYNLCKLAKSHWSGNEETRVSVAEKVSKTKKLQAAELDNKVGWNNWTPEQKAQASVSMSKGQKNRFKDPSQRQRLSGKAADAWKDPAVREKTLATMRSSENRAAISARNKAWQASVDPEVRRARARAGHSHPPSRELSCQLCGQKMLGHTKTKRFCSRSCQDKSYYQQKAAGT